MSLRPRTLSLSLKRTAAALAACGLLMGFTPAIKNAAAAPKASSSSSTTPTFNGDGRKN